jgi:hypothetical protein
MIHFADEHAESLIDRYMDGLLDDDRRREFERDVEADPDLRSSLARQRAIDESIRRVLAPPVETELRLIVERACREDRQRATRRLRLAGPTRKYALAASLLLALTGGWLLWSVLRPERGGFDPYAPQAYRSVETVYHDEIREGFEADWICESDREFRNTFWERFRQPLLLRELPKGITAVGLSYCNTISENTMILMAEVDDEPVVIFVDRVARDTEPITVEDERLHLHRRELSGLVLYELSPFDAPRVLPYFYDPVSSRPSASPSNEERAS